MQEKGLAVLRRILVLKPDSLRRKCHEEGRVVGGELLISVSLGVHSRLSSVDELRFLVFKMGSHTLQHDGGLIQGSPN
jgi:hypothetical protein